MAACGNLPSNDGLLYGCLLSFQPQADGVRVANLGQAAERPLLS
jgi:hypothetical protein